MIGEAIRRRWLVRMLQASSGSEADRWVNAIHTACTASQVRRHGRSATQRLLATDIDLLDIAIEQVSHVTSSRAFQFPRVFQLSNFVF